MAYVFSCPGTCRIVASASLLPARPPKRSRDAYALLYLVAGTGAPVWMGASASSCKVIGRDSHWVSTEEGERCLVGRKVGCSCRKKAVVVVDGALFSRLSQLLALG